MNYIIEAAAGFASGYAGSAIGVYPGTVEVIPLAAGVFYGTIPLAYRAFEYLQPSSISEDTIPNLMMSVAKLTACFAIPFIATYAIFGVPGLLFAREALFNTACTALSGYCIYLICEYVNANHFHVPGFQTGV